MNIINVKEFIHVEAKFVMKCYSFHNVKEPVIGVFLQTLMLGRVQNQ